MDLVFIYKDQHEDEVTAAIVRPQFMFTDDDLLINTPDGEFSALATFHSVKKEHPTLLKAAKRLVRWGDRPEVR